MQMQKIMSSLSSSARKPWSGRLSPWRCWTDGQESNRLSPESKISCSAAHVDGNADADYVADEDDLLNSEAVNTQRSCTIGPHTHP